MKCFKRMLRQKQPVLFLLMKILKSYNQSEALEQLKLAEDPCVVRLKKCEEALIEKPVFEINVENETGGIISLLRKTLDGLYFYDVYKQEDASVVIQYSDRSLCKEPSFDKNIFDYYFEQPSGVLISDLKKVSVIIEVTQRNFQLSTNMNPHTYLISAEYIDAQAAMLKKYLRFNKETEYCIHAEIDRRNIQSRTLGVHIRGTDFKKNYRGHPVYVPVEKYIEEIDEAFKSNLFDKVFLATDDEAVLAQMLMNYGGDKLIYARDIVRANGTDGVHTILGSTRESHQYLLGLEVLYDMCSLAHCDGIISGLSQVPNFSRVYKKANGQEYLWDKTINLGINKTGASHKKVFRRKKNNFLKLKRLKMK